jgi:hypothetical protein
VELLKNLIVAKDKGDHNCTHFVMKNFKQQKNVVKKKERRLTNFKEVERIDVFLQ